MFEQNQLTCFPEKWKEKGTFLSLKEDIVVTLFWSAPQLKGLEGGSWGWAQSSLTFREIILNLSVVLFWSDGDVHLKSLSLPS